MFLWHLDTLFSLKDSTLKCFASFLKIGSYVSLLRLEHVHSVFYGHKSSGDWTQKQMYVADSLLGSQSSVLSGVPG